MDIVIKPAKKPPKLNQADCMSQEARETLKALEQKYNAFMIKHHSNPADYYKRIYENTFKRELTTQTQEIPFRADTSTVKPQQTSNFNKNDIANNKNPQIQDSSFYSVCPTDRNEKLPSVASRSIKESPLIELNTYETFGRSYLRCEDRPTLLKKPSLSDIDSSMNSPQSLVMTPSRNLKRAYPNHDNLLKKWNRKFSQIASQYEDDELKNASRDYHHHQTLDFTKNCREDFQIDSELIWNNELCSQPDQNGSNIESLVHSSPSSSFSNQNMKSPALSEDPFAVFSLAENVEKSKLMNRSCTSKITHELFEQECIIESDKSSNFNKSPEINQSNFAIAGLLENSKEIFSNQYLPEAIDSDRNKNEKSVKKKDEPIANSVSVTDVQECAANSLERMPGTTTERQIDIKTDGMKLKNERRKRDNDNTTKKSVKKFRSRFRPPTMPSYESCIKTEPFPYPKKMKTTAAETTKETASGIPNVVDFFSLASEKKKAIIAEINLTQQIALTVVVSNGKSLINHFDAGIDWTRDACVILLTAESNCYQLHISLGTIEHVKLSTVSSIVTSLYLDRLIPKRRTFAHFAPSAWNALSAYTRHCNSLSSFKASLKTEYFLSVFCEEILFEMFSIGECEIVIPNSKEFFSSLYKVLHLDISSLVSCDNLEDPVLASWLLNPDKQPTSFSMMCQTAHLKFMGVENDWLSCLCFTKKLMCSLKKRLEGDNLLRLYKNIEIKLVPLLASMENQSLRVKTEVFRKFADVLKNKLHKLEESAYKEVGHKFIINSHPQLRQILYEELKLDEKLPPTAKIGKTSVSHQKSTCESSLLLLSGLHPLPSILLEYRTLQKLKSTYIDGMLSCMTNNSISTHWDQTSAATGRLTSYQPNIQNVPKTAVVVEDYLPNTILGSAPKSCAEIYAREPFISHDGFVFLAADFQQIELRILAHLSDDKALLSMFWNPDSVDVFSLLTAEWKNTEVDKVSIDERETTKRIVYSVMYGVGKDKLADYLKVKPDIAKEIMKDFLVRFPAIDFFTKKCCSYAKEYGYTETICGRRRYFPYINSHSPALRAQAQRQAVNFCVQGSAADICKSAMLEVESRLRKNSDLNYRLLLQIHDELLWEVAEDQLLMVKEMIENVIEDAKTLCGKFCSLQVPLTVSFSQGKSWAHLRPVNSILSNEI